MPSRAGCDGAESVSWVVDGADGVDMEFSRCGVPGTGAKKGRTGLPTEHATVIGDCLRLVLVKIRRESPVCKE
ncbi:hypothetical protein GCM10010121_057130 [Streptomyces brasiliensis]|uniref:Uncharacterized protein n=1 Tax=Streptomyces brasiliensis TaxID=1954 RepID=A0A917NXP5_9ACTN|nr:hypothetical protein GCM10010121_057130 [Streptomyces brasiliensis]